MKKTVLLMLGLLLSVSMVSGVIEDGFAIEDFEAYAAGSQPTDPGFGTWTNQPSGGVVEVSTSGPLEGQKSLFINNLDNSNRPSAFLTLDEQFEVPLDTVTYTTSGDGALNRINPPEGAEMTSYLVEGNQVLRCTGVGGCSGQSTTVLSSSSGTACGGSPYTFIHFFDWDAQQQTTEIRSGSTLCITDSNVPFLTAGDAVGRWQTTIQSGGTQAKFDSFIFESPVFVAEGGPEPAEFADGLDAFIAEFGFVTVESQFFFTIILVGIVTILTGGGLILLASGRIKNYILAGAGVLVGLFTVFKGYLDTWVFIMAFMLTVFGVRGAPEVRNTYAELRAAIARNKQANLQGDDMGDEQEPSQPPSEPAGPPPPAAAPEAPDAAAEGPEASQDNDQAQATQDPPSEPPAASTSTEDA